MIENILNCHFCGNGDLPLSEWLQTTMEGRYLMMGITFPIANHFNIHSEKIPIELVVEIIESIGISFENGYAKGWKDATSEACKEIEKNYRPNNR